MRQATAILTLSDTFFSDEFEKVSEPLEEGNEVLRLSYEEAERELFHPHHAWAVELIRERMENQGEKKMLE